MKDKMLVRYKNNKYKNIKHLYGGTNAYKEGYSRMQNLRKRV
jgi:hypothetical protein